MMQYYLSRLSHSLLIICAFALPLSTTVTDVLFPIAVMINFSSFCFAPEPKIVRLLNPISLSLMGFFVLFLLGALYTIAPLSDVIHRLLQIICLLFSGFLVVGITDEKLRSYLCNAFLIAMIITLVLSYCKYYAAWPVSNTAKFDAASVFKDHIIQNFLMVIALFIFLYRCFNKKLNIYYRLCYSLISILTIFNILFMSSGRSGYVIFAALLIAMGIIYFGWRGALASLIALIVLVSAAYVSSHAFKTGVLAVQQNAVQYEQGKPDTSVGIRLQSIKNAYQLFLQRPWLGYGTGSFATAYERLPPAEIGAVGYVPLSYNHYLNVGVELGVVGLGFLILLFALQWRYSFFLTGEWKFITQILLITMIVGCFANPWLADTTELHFYALFLAIGFSTLQRKPVDITNNHIGLQITQTF